MSAWKNCDTMAFIFDTVSYCTSIPEWMMIHLICDHQIRVSFSHRNAIAEAFIVQRRESWSPLPNPRKQDLEVDSFTRPELVSNHAVIGYSLDL